MTDPQEISSPSGHTGAVAAAAAVAVASSQAVSAAEAEDKFLAGIRSDDENANYAAWSNVADVDPGVIPALCELLVSKKLNVRKAAEEALKNFVHSVGKTIDPRSFGANIGRPDDPGRMDRRQLVVMHFLVVLEESKRHGTERATALRHLSLIATTDDVDRVAAFIHDPHLREEAAFCLERIPGKAAEEALLKALPSVSDDFKPRILAALGHRMAEEAVGACIEAMGSADPDIAIAGMKAWARIGLSDGSKVPYPALDGLSEWQRIEFGDSLLRFADGQLQAGNADEAMEIYLDALARDAEHLQCAAMLGLGKIASAEAAAAIFPRLSSSNNTVRITARQVWSRLAAGEEA